MIDSSEITKADGEVVGLDGSFASHGRLTRQDRNRDISFALLFRQKLDESVFQCVCFRLFKELHRCAGGKYGTVSYNFV